MFKTTIVAVSSILMLVVLSGVDAARKTDRQADEKPAIVQLAHYPAWMEIPIQVTEIKVKGKKVELDWFFKAGDTWLKDLSVVVRNTSDRPIAGVALTLDWGNDPADDEPYLPQTFLYAGAQYQVEKGGVRAPLTLAPGQEVEVFVEKSWSDTHYNHRAGTARALHKPLPADIGRKATLYYEYIGFDADNIWLHGEFARRDPNNQARFIPDEEKRKRVSQILRLIPRIQKASYTPGRLPGCVRWSNSEAVACTTASCPFSPGCTVVKDITTDETTGFERHNISVECQKKVGTQLVACGCCQKVQRVNHDKGCNQ